MSIHGLNGLILYFLEITVLFFFRYADISNKVRKGTSAPNGSGTMRRDIVPDYVTLDFYHQRGIIKICFCCFLSCG